MYVCMYVCMCVCVMYAHTYACMYAYSVYVFFIDHLSVGHGASERTDFFGFCCPPDSRNGRRRFGCRAMAILPYHGRTRIWNT